MNDNEKYLSIKRYATLTAVILFLLVMMFFIIDLERFIRVREVESEKTELADLTMDQPISLMNQSDLTEDILMIDGKELETDQDFQELYQFIEENKAVIFLSLPSQEYIEEYNLGEVLGINKIAGEKKQKELNLVAGFMLGGLYQFEKIDYNTLDLDLSFSTKVYGYGKKTPSKEYPVIWRNTYEGSEIYSINGPFMETKASDGILSAILSEIHEDHIYPVINARLMVYESFPYVSYGNKKQLEKNYNRDAMKLQHDVFFPDLLSINKLRGFIPNGFFRLGFEEGAIDSVKAHDKRQLTTYQEQIFKDGGEVGLRYSGDILQNQDAYNQLFKKSTIKSILVSEEPVDLDEFLQSTPSVEAVLGPFEKEKNFSYLNEQAVYLSFTAEGFQQNGQEELDFISMVTAFGAIIQNLNLEEIVKPEDGKEKWTAGQKKYVQFLDKHREKFYFLKDRNITETSDAVKTLLNNAPEINQSATQIELHFPNWYGESYYILRTNKKIKSIRNGTSKEIEENAYLVTATGKEVTIELSN